MERAEKIEAYGEEEEEEEEETVDSRPNLFVQALAPVSVKMESKVHGAQSKRRSRGGSSPVAVRAKGWEAAVVAC